ncbi:hypothetical protein SUDANB129_05531 [Streptomyces sp. enrichment culture]
MTSVTAFMHPSDTSLLPSLAAHLGRALWTASRRWASFARHEALGKHATDGTDGT